MIRTAPAILAALVTVTVATPTFANGSAAPDPGRALVEAQCARCHAVDRQGDSPFDPAPPLRDIAARYPLEGLEEAFAEGIVVGHPAMPEFELEPEEIGALIEYLEWLIEPVAQPES